MSISAIILTYNESQHLRRCIESLLPVVDSVFVYDSFSTDDTLTIAKRYNNVEVRQGEFINHAIQFNKALDEFDINTDWIMRIDADEYIDEECRHYIMDSLGLLEDGVTGVYLNRYMNFLGRTLTYGGMDNYWMLRIWRNGYGRCENRWMDEHIVLREGKTVKATGRLVDHNLNSLSWWSHKHVDYSTREAIDVIAKEIDSKEELKPKLFGTSSERTRFLKGYYNKIPLFIRPFLYFIYRYFLKAGFLDGRQGFLWAILQGFWYRMLVDAKIFEIKKEVASGDMTFEEIVKEKYGINYK